MRAMAPNSHFITEIDTWIKVLTPSMLPGDTLQKVITAALAPAKRASTRITQTRQPTSLVAWVCAAAPQQLARNPTRPQSCQYPPSAAFGRPQRLANAARARSSSTVVAATARPAPRCRSREGCDLGR
jgi:hypothetical protein